MRIQVNELVDLKTFTEDPANNPQKIKFKSLAERRRYVKDKLKLSTAIDPKTGLESVPVHSKTLMLKGHRVTASRTKQDTFEDKHESKAAFNQARGGVDVATNQKAGQVDGRVDPARRLRFIPCSYYNTVQYVHSRFRLK